MPLNDKPCNTCLSYDPILLGDGSKQARRGWCAKKSVYPNQEQDGQIFPANVRRAESGKIAQPYIVIGSEVEGIKSVLFYIKQRLEQSKV